MFQSEATLRAAGFDGFVSVAALLDTRLDSLRIPLNFCRTADYPRRTSDGYAAERHNLSYVHS